MATTTTGPSFANVASALLVTGLFIGGVWVAVELATMKPAYAAPPSGRRTILPPPPEEVRVPRSQMYRPDIIQVPRFRGGKQVDARKWLASGNEFATNRFRYVNDAYAFVNQLRALGATKVNVAEIDKGSEGNVFSDTLYVTLPASRPRREELLDFVEQKANADELRLANRNKILRIWWD